MGETDLISRQAVIDALDSFILDETTDVYGDTVREILERLPTIERKTGKWEERKVSTEKVIDEWQSCKCSVCGRYDTRPYLYYFDEPRFCSWCGSDMRA